MATSNWWSGAQPRKDICEGKVNEALFTAKLGEAVEGEGALEYRDAETFFSKTYLTRGLRELLVDILRTLDGQKGQNAVANLRTSFGGGKTHAELAIYHLLKHPAESLRAPEVRDLFAEVTMPAPPASRMAVLACSRLNPLGRDTQDGLSIKTLWGEMAYQLGGKETFALVADNDARLVSPGEAALEGVLKQVGPCVILFDETLHYVDKASALKGAEGDLAKQTVAFLRELTVAVDSVPRCMLVVSLTASRMDQLSDQALVWLERMDKHVNRIASARTPIEGTEIYEIVRQRLFEQVSEDAARQAAETYHDLYAGLGGLPAHASGEEYRQQIERSFPFHPELVTILYERWGSKPGFQLTRGTLQFLALALQDLWSRRHAHHALLIQPGDVSLGESRLRAFVRDVAGDPKWESVLGSDVVTPYGSPPAKAQSIDRERADGLTTAEAMATTIFLYSLSGGENPFAAQHELRLACSRPGIAESQWDDALDTLRGRLFYLYPEDGRYRFRMEPNVVSLHHTYRTNLQQSPEEVQAYLLRTIPSKAFGIDSAFHQFARVYFRPEDSADIPNDDELKLIVLGFEHCTHDGELSDEARDEMMRLLQRHGQVLRQYRNRIVFCVADDNEAHTAENLAGNYLAWRKIQTNPTDWDRIGGAQQQLVKEEVEVTEGAAHKALISAYKWAAVPTEEPKTGQLGLRLVPLGAYGPGKLVAPMVWDRLTSGDGPAERILTSLTPETLVERHGPRAWPESEAWVTTGQLWDRFSRQVALPMLSRPQVLMDTLVLGQREGFLAIGHLVDEASQRDQRDSYLALFFEEAALPPNVPGIGERWLIMRPTMYKQIVHQPAMVTADEIRQAVEELRGTADVLPVSAVYKYVRARKQDSIDDSSFHAAVKAVMHKGGLAFHTAPDGHDVGVVPADEQQMMGGFLAIPNKGPVVEPPKKGRTITLRGRLSTLQQLAPLYQKVLNVLHSQGPKEFTIGLDVTARFDQDPGAGFDAALADGFDPREFPGLKLQDSKEQGST